MLVPDLIRDGIQKAPIIAGFPLEFTLMKMGAGMTKWWLPH